MAGNVTVSLFERLTTIDDPRDKRGKKYPLPYLLSLIVIGFLIGKTDFVNMEHVFRKRQKGLKKIFGKYYAGVPSHDTFSRIMRMIPEEEMRYALFDWIAGIISVKKGHIAIDGKGLRAATEKNRKQTTPYILNALHVGYKFVIGQLKINEKTNEITGIPKLLKFLDIEDTVITIDAIGTQVGIAELIVKRGGHYVLPVKENQSKTVDAIASFMSDRILEEKKKNENPLYESDYDDVVHMCEDYEHDHGREEHRTYYLSTNLQCIKGLNFKNVKAIGFIIRERKMPVKDEDGKMIRYEESVDRISYIMDQELSVQEFAGYVRGHWRIENSLHWVLDNTFKEDRSTAKKGNAINNISFLRKVAYNLIRIFKMREIEKSFEYVQDEFNNDIDLIKKYVIEEIERLN